MRPTLLTLLLAAAVSAQDAGRPRFNDSYIASQRDETMSLVASAVAAATEGRAAAAADRLQVLLFEAPEGLVPMREGLLYVSPRRWAQLKLLSGEKPFGPEVLAAWRKVHDRQASARLRLAMRDRDEVAILNLLSRHPAAMAAPAALLALCDAALLRGDPDGARGYLLRLPEHLERARIEAFCATEAYQRRLQHLKALGDRSPRGWPTLGGDATRARNGDALPKGALVRKWATPFLEGFPPSLERDEEDAHRHPHSPMLPFYPTCDDTYVYVHCVTAVAGLDRRTGKIRFYAPAPPNETVLDETLLRNPGVRAATVADGVLYFNRVLSDDDEEPAVTNELQAYDVARKSTLWQVRQSARWRETCPPLARPIFFRGAPAVVGDRLYVCGAVRDEGDDGPTRKEEAYAFCFSRRTGQPLWHRFIGAGSTQASPEFPPLGGLPIAVGRGVAVAVTGFGVAAAMDARTGEVLWLLRYDRKPPDDAQRLAEITQESAVLFKSTWMREPPRIFGDSVYFAPFDGREMFACWLRGTRARNGAFAVEQWAKARDTGHGSHSHLEYVAGIVAGRIHYVGRRDPRPEFTAGYKTVVAHPLDRTVGWSAGLVPAILRDKDGLAVPPEVHGRPCIAGGTLLVPTRDAIFRFAVSKDAIVKLDKQGELTREIPYLAPYLAPDPVEEEFPTAAFGTLVASGGFLYTVTANRVICYAPRK